MSPMGDETRADLRQVTQEAIDAHSKGRAIPWREILIAVGMLGSNATTGTVASHFSGSPDTACVEKVVEQNRACHEFIARCMDLVGERDHGSSGN